MFRIFGRKGLAKARPFNYIPRFYDEEKDRLRSKYEDKDMSPEAIKARIARANQRARHKRRGLTDRSQSRAMFVRVLLILLALLVITYWLLGLVLPALDKYMH